MEGDPQKSYEELGIFGGLRLSQFLSSLTADHYLWRSGGVSCCFEGVPGYNGMFQGCSGVVPGCSGRFRGCSGVVPGCSGVFRGVPGCSGVFRGVPGFTDTLQRNSQSKFLLLARSSVCKFPTTAIGFFRYIKIQLGSEAWRTQIKEILQACLFISFVCVL